MRDLLERWSDGVNVSGHEVRFFLFYYDLLNLFNIHLRILLPFILSLFRWAPWFLLLFNNGNFFIWANSFLFTNHFSMVLSQPIFGVNRPYRSRWLFILNLKRPFKGFEWLLAKVGTFIVCMIGKFEQLKLIIFFEILTECINGFLWTSSRFFTFDTFILFHGISKESQVFNHSWGATILNICWSDFLIYYSCTGKWRETHLRFRKPFEIIQDLLALQVIHANWVIFTTLLDKVSSLLLIIKLLIQIYPSHLIYFFIKFIELIEKHGILWVRWRLPEVF